MSQHQIWESCGEPLFIINIKERNFIFSTRSTFSQTPPFVYVPKCFVSSIQKEFSLMTVVGRASSFTYFIPSRYLIKTKSADLWGTQADEYLSFLLNKLHIQQEKLEQMSIEREIKIKNLQNQAIIILKALLFGQNLNNLRKIAVRIIQDKDNLGFITDAFSKKINGRYSLLRLTMKLRINQFKTRNILKYNCISWNISILEQATSKLKVKILVKWRKINNWEFVNKSLCKIAVFLIKSQQIASFGSNNPI